MKFSKVTSFCFLLAVVIVCSSAVSNDTSTTTGEITVTSSPVTSNGTTATTSKPISSTTAPTTTAASTTQITTITPKPAPSSTTAASTSSPAPVTTTQIPVTSSSPAPTTTPPTPAENVWFVNSGNETCILMKSNVVLDVTSVLNATTKQTIPIPNNAKATGECGNSSQYLQLSWEQPANKTNTLKFVFSKGTENKCEYFLSNISSTVFVNSTNGTEVTPINLAFTGKEFVAHDGVSYMCTKPSPVKLSGPSNSTSAELHLNSLQYEAYHKKEDKAFSSAQNCVPRETPDMVPILVAGGLILLVVFVLAAYVITRRRSQARGYLSM